MCIVATDFNQVKQMSEFSENLPNIGDGVIEGEIVEWFVKIGDLVQTDDPIVSVITDKATVEIPYHSKKSAYVSQLHGEVGDMIAVNSPLITFSVVTEEDISNDFEYVMDKIMEVDSRLLAQIGPTYQSLAREDRLDRSVFQWEDFSYKSHNVRLSTNKFDRRLAILQGINERNRKFTDLLYRQDLKLAKNLFESVFEELAMEKEAQSEDPEHWVCPKCNCSNFAGRVECNRCGQPKPSVRGNTDGISSQNSTEIAAYIELGLEESYAKAIVAGIDAEEIMALWEADWRKQYESDDFLIDAVLTGKITTNDAEYLNQIRSDHNDLVYACLNEKVSIEWAKALMDAGFNTYPNAVNSILRGTDPAVTARLLNLDVNIDLLPPKLT